MIIFVVAVIAKHSYFDVATPLQTAWDAFGGNSDLDNQFICIHLVVGGRGGGSILFCSG